MLDTSFALFQPLLKETGSCSACCGRKALALLILLVSLCVVGLHSPMWCAICMVGNYVLAWEPTMTLAMQCLKLARISRHLQFANLHRPMQMMISRPVHLARSQNCMQNIAARAVNHAAAVTPGALNALGFQLRQRHLHGKIVHSLEKRLHFSARKYGPNGEQSSKSRPKKFIIDWAEGHGADCSNVEVREFLKDGHAVRGLAAARDISAREIVLSIPFEIVMSSRVLPAVPGCRELWISVESNFHRLVLQVLLERSRGKDSPWYEWLQMLPSLEDYAQFYPYAAGEEVFQDFSALDIVAAHANLRRDLETLRESTRKFLAVHPRSCFPELPSWEDFLWAECVVATRNYGDIDGTSENTIVPLADFANAPSGIDESSNVQYEWAEGRSFFHLVAKRVIMRGEEILEPYAELDQRNIVGGHDEVLDSWGFLTTAHQDLARQKAALPAEQCARLLPSVMKYLSPDGVCIRDPVAACNLARLVRLRCDRGDQPIKGDASGKMA